MTPIIVVATNTFRQTVRQRLFFNVIVFGIGMVLLSMVVGNLTFGFPDRVVRSIGLSGVAIALDIMALLVSVSLIHEEIDKKTLFVVLSRPIRRWQYVVGRYLGLLLALIAATGGFGIVFAGTLAIVSGSLQLTDVFALIAIIPEAAIVAGIGLVLSAFTTPTLGAGIGIGIWIAAATTDDLVRIAQNADPLTKGIATAIYYIFPSLARFNFRTQAVYQIPISITDFLATLAYGGVYMAFLVILASVILSRREMV